MSTCGSIVDARCAGAQLLRCAARSVARARSRARSRALLRASLARCGARVARAACSVVVVCWLVRTIVLACNVVSRWVVGR